MLIHKLFEGHTCRTPTKTIAYCGREKLSFDDLNRRSNLLAARLLASGLLPSQHVGIYLDHSFDLLAAVLGVLKCGAVCVPLSGDNPANRLSRLIKAAAITTVITSIQDRTQLLREGLVVVAPGGHEEQLADERCRENPTVPISELDLAFVNHTSGSTGEPKGVMRSHRATALRLHGAIEKFPVADSDRLLAYAPINLVVSIDELLIPLLGGPPAVMAARAMGRDIRSLIDLMATQAVSLVHMTPSVLRIFLQDPKLDRCRSLRHVLLSGEPVGGDLRQAFYSRLEATLWIAYGCTEAPGAAGWRCSRGQHNSLPLLGQPCADSEVHILTDALQLATPGEFGEICLGGPSLASGYFDDDRLTSHQFVPNPSSNESASRLFRTGDRGRYRSDGFLEYGGRLAERYKVRGLRVDLTEIERRLRELDSIADAAALIREDQPGEQSLVAYVVASDSSVPSTDQIRLQLSEHLPQFMEPSHIVALDELPRNQGGKLDRAALPAPTTSRPALQSPFAKPESRTEERLLGILENVLRLDSLGVADNIFDLGANSLQAVCILAGIEDEFGSRLAIADLLNFPTVRKLAKSLGEPNSGAGHGSVAPISEGGPNPGIFCIPGVSGNVLVFQELSKALGRSRPIYGLSPFGLDSAEPPYRRLDQIASHYVQEMVNLQPTGPYNLAGFCFGGVVAFEMARQLRSQGKEVELLAIMDTPGPGFRKGAGRLRGYLHGAAMWLSTHLGNLEPRDAGQRRDYFLERLGIMLWRFGINKSAKREAELTLMDAHLAAAKQYQPEPYSGTATLFFSEPSLFHVPSDDYHGWGEFIDPKPDIVHVPGMHLSMMRQPGVAAIATELRTRLDESRA